MAIDHKIRDENLQYNINGQTAKTLLSGKIDKYEYLTGKEILHPLAPPHPTSNQSRIIEQSECKNKTIYVHFIKQKLSGYSLSSLLLN